MGSFNRTLTGLFILCFIFVCSRAEKETEAEKKYFNTEHKLVDDLFVKNAYSKDLIPSTNDNATIKVNFGLALLEIIELNEVREYLDVVIWMRKLWNDKRLQWNPEDYDGITNIRIPSDQVWQPDIVSYNHPKNDWYFNNNVVVYNTGDVLFIPPGETRMKCVVDMTYFPGDVQHCTVKFGSWTFDGTRLNLQFYEGKEEIDLTDYFQNKKFKIVKNRAQKNIIYYPCCSEPYPDLTFELEIHRRASALYLSLLLVPGLLVALLSPFIFVLPSGGLHKFILGGALMLCLLVMMSILGHAIPIQPSPPLFVHYFSGLFVIVCVSLGLTAVTTNLAHHSMQLRTMPGFLKALTTCLARPCCVNTNQNYNQIDERRLSDPASGDKDTMVKAPRGDWCILAAILDRLFFIISAAIVIILSLAILPQILNFDA